MSESRLTDYLDHINEAASHARSYVDGWTKEEFLADKRTQQAIIMNLIIIGEAATKLMEHHIDFTQKNSQIPWRSMRNMRNRIAHGYFDIDLEVVWETIQQWLPELLEQLTMIRQSTTNNDRFDNS